MTPSDLKVRAFKARSPEHQASLSNIGAQASRSLEQQEHDPRELNELELISPIQRVPVEILIEIFFHCRPLIPNTRSSSRNAPMLLTQICHLWRRLVLETPALWTQVAFYVNHKDIDAMQHYWMARAGTASLLSVSLLSRPETAISTSLDRHSQELAFLASYIPRIESLYLLGRCALRAIPAGPFEMLRSLEIEHFIHDPAFRDPIKSFQYCPSLREVTLRKFDLRSPLPKIPWSQLTHLSVNNGSTMDFGITWDIISSCSSLTHLTIREHHRFTDIQNSEVVLPHLCFLDLSLTDTEVKAIFSRLTAPALKELRMTRCFKHSIPWLELLKEYHAFKARSAFTLERLVANLGNNLDENLELIQEIYSLQELTLNFLNLDLKAFNAFTLDENLLVPKLRSLTLYTTYSHMDPDLRSAFNRSIIDMVRSRWEPRGSSTNERKCLKRLSLHSQKTHFEEETLAQLRVFWAQGLNLDINLQ